MDHCGFMDFVDSVFGSSCSHYSGCSNCHNLAKESFLKLAPVPFGLDLLIFERFVAFRFER